jgi:hypothetical protein
MTDITKSEIDCDKEEIEIIDGNKHVTIYRKGAEGIIYKHTKIYRLETHKIKVPKKVAERKTWEKFGVSKGLPSGPDTASTNRVFDEVFFEFTNNKKIGDDSDDNMGMFGSNSKNVVTCKYCSGNHWSIKCKNKPDKIKDKKDLPSNGKYVPKFKRDGEKPIDKNRNTIRISNISDNADEQDLRELFVNYGRITRLYYNQSGFAFLTYSDINSCEKAIESVNGHPYDYLILRVEMAESKV